MAKIIDGKAIAMKIREEVADEVGPPIPEPDPP